MLTLGFASQPDWGPTAVMFIAATTGLIVVALQVAYLPTLYGAFNRRESLVTLLQSRAGAPAWGPELLTRHVIVGLVDNLGQLYLDWEEWAADVAESHTNYPVLVWFRSPHPLRSWVIARLAVQVGARNGSGSDEAVAAEASLVAAAARRSEPLLSLEPRQGSSARAVNDRDRSHRDHEHRAAHAQHAREDPVFIERVL